jgi:hypothetical protein
VLGKRSKICCYCGTVSTVTVLSTVCCYCGTVRSVTVLSTVCCYCGNVSSGTVPEYSMLLLWDY